MTKRCWYELNHNWAINTVMGRYLGNNHAKGLVDGEYFAGVKEIIIIVPYIILPYEIRNLVKLISLLVYL